MVELVHLEVGDRVATVTLDSPQNRNALSVDLLHQLDAHLRRVAADASISGLVLTAVGSTFCSGADLSGASSAAGRAASFVEILELLWSYPKTVIARLNGHVRAGGLGLVAAADVVIAPSSASFAFSEVRIGVAPAVIAVLCQRRMPSRAASRYLLTGEVFDAQAAVEAGLVTTVVAPEWLDEATDEVVDAVRQTEPRAVAATRRLLVELPSMSVADGLRHAEGVSTALFASQEAAEGIAAMREKRAPAWADRRPASRPPPRRDVLADDRELVALSYEYARCIDERDFEALRQLFTDDAVFHYHVAGSTPRQGADAFVMAAATGLERIDVTQHVFTNHRFVIDGDVAHGRFSMLAQHVDRSRPDGRSYLLGGEYDDEYVRTPAGWRISRRDFHPGWGWGNPEVPGGGYPDDMR